LTDLQLQPKIPPALLKKAMNLAASTIQKWWRQKRRMEMPRQIRESLIKPKQIQEHFSRDFKNKIDEDIVNIDNFIMELDEDLEEPVENKTSDSNTKMIGNGRHRLFETSNKSI